MDRDGCPDNDGDGTSDINDAWTINNPNFTNEQTISSSNEYFDVDFSPDGTHVVTASEDGYVRVWNASSFTNVRSAYAIPGGEVTSVDWSPDGQYIAAGLDDDSMQIYYASNLTSVHGSISVDVGGGDFVNDVRFNPDSDLVAVSIGRSGNGGTNGQAFLIQVADGSNLHSLNPNGEAAHPRHDLSCGHTGGWRVFALMVLSVALVSLLLAGVRHSARALEHGPTPVPTPAPSVTLAPVCANIDAEVHDLLAELEDTKARLANALDRKAQADTRGETR